MKQITSKLLYFALMAGIILLFLFADKINSHYKNYLIPPVSVVGEPYLHNGDGIKLNSFNAGDVFFIRVFTERVVACSAEISYNIMKFLPDENDHKRRIFLYNYPTGIGFSGIGKYETDERLVIPSWLKAGEYSFTRFGNYDCNGVNIKTGSVVIPIVIR